MTSGPDASPLTSGDIVWLDLRPTLGREQSGVRPAAVLTDAEFHYRNSTAVICPITRNTQPWPFKVFLPKGLPVTGAVLIDQIRSVDRTARGFRRIGAVPPAIMADIRSRIVLLVGAASEVPLPRDNP